mmetsp:Transcript_66031/g.149025  ORF Transcript_66031/g.149025 Transcript_66031/m.149025 type:complete len:264 (-) Transcript_66031:815-1606(-)
MASSISSMRLVRPTTKTLPSSSTPSSLARSWFTTLSLTPEVSPCNDPRSRHTASNSSITTTCKPDLAPDCFHSISAGLKSSRMRSSLVPTNLLSTSGPLTTRHEDASNAWASCRASRVFPQPGGPWRRRPRTGCTPSIRAVKGSKLRVASTRRPIVANSASNPPTWSSRAAGLCRPSKIRAAPPPFAEGTEAFSGAKSACARGAKSGRSPTAREEAWPAAWPEAVPVIITPLPPPGGGTIMTSRSRHGSSGLAARARAGPPSM